MNPYKENEKFCEDCSAREEHLNRMLPFKPEHKRTCPACLATEGKIHLKWTLVCTGRRRLILKKGFWLFGRHGEEVLPCDISTEHFHLTCNVCEYDWLMLTALDSDKDENEDEDED